MKSMEQCIGSTPLVRLSRLMPEVPLYAKIEGQNPGGSVKDRAALAMITQAEKQGLLQPGGTLIEATSGNTGIGLAWIAAQRGYRCILVMPDSMSPERQQLLRAYGAQVVLTPGKLGMSGALEQAYALLRVIPNSFLPDQFHNPANVECHYRTTGPELWTQTSSALDCFVAGVGTGGTLTGVARYLKMKNPHIRIVAVEPASSPLLSAGWSGPHGIQGIGSNFLPPLLDLQLVDEIIPVTESDAFEAAKVLASREGILAGISSGAALHAAQILTQRPENREKTVVTLLPDSGMRYLSTVLFG